MPLLFSAVTVITVTVLFGLVQKSCPNPNPSMRDKRDFPDSSEFERDELDVIFGLEPCYNDFDCKPGYFCNENLKSKNREHFYCQFNTTYYEKLIATAVEIIKPDTTTNHEKTSKINSADEFLRIMTDTKAALEECEKNKTALEKERESAGKLDAWPWILSGVAIGLVIGVFVGYGAKAGWNPLHLFRRNRNNDDDLITQDVILPEIVLSNRISPHPICDMLQRVNRVTEEDSPKGPSVA